MLQRIMNRFTEQGSSEHRELVAGVPAPWPNSSGLVNASRLLSRTNTIKQDLEKNSFAYERSDTNEHQPLLATPSVPERSHHPIEASNRAMTGLAALRLPLDFKDQHALDTIRRDAAYVRDTHFAQHVTSVLHEVKAEKPSVYKEGMFCYYEVNYHWKKSLQPRRLSLLQNIYESIEPNNCRFRKPDAEAFASAFITEFTGFCYSIPTSTADRPAIIKNLIDWAAPIIEAISCDGETEREIQETFNLAVMHYLWQSATLAQAAGQTCVLEHYLSMHALLQAQVIAHQAASVIEKALV